ncbi:MAG: amino acid ABC transporter substrate-binding protein, partial [Pseudomonadota bacterium]|nr:amino acid ABC transporter substrate-binding protein [Pseudomonadota bacterium]
MAVGKPVLTILVTLLACLLLANTPARAEQTEITLGVYHFPPIASVDEDGNAEGLLGDLLQTLQQTHPGLSFRIFHTSPKRRHLDFDTGLYDVIFFESPLWGWSNRPVEISAPILEDEELYVALNKPGRD